MTGNFIISNKEWTIPLTNWRNTCTFRLSNKIFYIKEAP